jgi:hypothetical protein
LLLITLLLMKLVQPIRVKLLQTLTWVILSTMVLLITLPQGGLVPSRQAVGQVAMEPSEQMGLDLASTTSIQSSPVHK